MTMAPAQCCCGRTSCVEGVEILLHLRLRYKPGLYQYWEATVIPAWKAALAFLLVFTSDGTQIALLAVLLLARLAVYHFFPPYVLALNNREECWLHVGALLVLLGGVMFFYAAPGDTAAGKALEVASFILCTATMCVMLLLIGWIMWSVVREYRTEKAVAAAQGLPVPDDLEQDNALNAELAARDEAAEESSAEDGLLSQAGQQAAEPIAYVEPHAMLEMSRRSSTVSRLAQLQAPLLLSSKEDAAHFFPPRTESYSSSHLR